MMVVYLVFVGFGVLVRWWVVVCWFGWFWWLVLFGCFDCGFCLGLGFGVCVLRCWWVCC